MVCVFFAYNSKTLSNNLDKERLEKESMLSEKIHLIRILEKLKKEVAAKDSMDAFEKKLN